MPALPNPYVSDPTIATQPLPFLLDAAKFERDLYGKHRLPEVEPIEVDEHWTMPILEVLTRY